jgi:hypothetical protein
MGLQIEVGDFHEVKVKVKVEVEVKVKVRERGVALKRENWTGSK